MLLLILLLRKYLHFPFWNLYCPKIYFKVRAMASSQIRLIIILCLHLISWKDISPLCWNFLTICLGLDARNPFCHFSSTFVPRLRGSRGLTLSSLSYKKFHHLDIVPTSLQAVFFVFDQSLNRRGWLWCHPCVQQQKVEREAEISFWLTSFKFIQFSGRHLFHCYSFEG